MTPLSIPAAASILGYGRTTVWKLCRDGKIVSHRDGKLIKIDLDDLEKYKASTRCTSICQFSRKAA
jgi:excisionase family DNA binding protein